MAGVIAIALLLQSNAIPLARFTGNVHGVTRKQITIDTEEGNVVEFAVNRKTRTERAGKMVPVTDLKTGDAVTVEAKQELLGYLVAVSIKAPAAPAN